MKNLALKSDVVVAVQSCCRLKFHICFRFTQSKLLMHSEFLIILIQLHDRRGSPRMAQPFLSFTPKRLGKNDVTERQVLHHGIEMAVALQAPDWKVSLPWSQNSWRSPERQTGGGCNRTPGKRESHLFLFPSTWVQFSYFVEGCFFSAFFCSTFFWDRKIDKPKMTGWQVDWSFQFLRVMPIEPYNGLL